MPVQCICRRCGASFQVTPSVFARGFGLYCSRACWTPPVERTCVRCGMAFQVKPYLAAKGFGKYCCSACFFATKPRHGDTRGGTQTPEHRAWSHLKDRCLNSSHRQYADYGGRGITVCDRWRDSYEVFLADVGRRPSPTHSIDRIDNDQGYFPGNVRWATSSEQRANQRPRRVM